MIITRFWRLVTLLLLFTSVVSTDAWSKTGEELFRELRHQVEVQRQGMNSEELESVGNSIGRAFFAPSGNQLTECSQDAVSALLDGRLVSTSGELSWYIYNALYVPEILPVGKNYCIYLKKPIARALTVEEARDLLVAWRLPAFPQYVPGQEDRQRAEEQFAALRDEARRFRSNWSAERLSRLDAVANSFVECIDDDLEKENVLKELPKQKENIEAINGVEYVWTTALVRSAPGGAGICIYIRSPLHRGLSLDEVRDFLTLSQTQEFSSDDFVPRRGMRRLPADGQLSSKLPQKDSTTSLGGPPVAGAKSDSRRRVEGGMPYLTMAYVRTHDSAECDTGFAHDQLHVYEGRHHTAGRRVLRLADDQPSVAIHDDRDPAA